MDFEASLVAKFDELVNVVQKRRDQLIVQVSCNVGHISDAEMNVSAYEFLQP